MTATAPTIALDRASAAELARVLTVLAEFLATRPAARASLARFTHHGHPDPYFWTDELLNYLGETAAELQQLSTSPAKDPS
jgi:hypothetical protein